MAFITIKPDAVINVEYSFLCIFTNFYSDFGRLAETVEESATRPDHAAVQFNHGTGEEQVCSCACVCS